MVDAKQVFSQCTVTISKKSAGPSGLNYFLKYIIYHTLLTHQKQVVDAKNVFSHCTATFLKIWCGTVWPENVVIMCSVTKSAE